MKRMLDAFLARRRKKLKRIEELTGIITIIFIALMTGQLLYVLPISGIKAEPILVMMIGVAFFYLMMIGLSLAEEAIKGRLIKRR